ncbi:MAG: hypothetical protein RL748_4207, partial [Pseudomonadota bacterium]
MTHQQPHHLPLASGDERADIYEAGPH